jgi:hypothetical protein
VKLVRQTILLVVVVAVALRVAGVPMNSSLLWVAATAEACLVALVFLGLLHVLRARARAPEGEAGLQGWDALRGVLRESLPESVTEAGRNRACSSQAMKSAHDCAASVTRRLRRCLSAQGSCAGP